MIAPPPPRLTDLPVGTRLVAGLGFSTVYPSIDFETFSEAGCVFDPLKKRWVGPPGAPKGQKSLPVVGAAAYAMHPSTEVLCLAYDSHDGRGAQLWIPQMPPPVELFRCLTQSKLSAWNAQFEFWIWNYVCTRRYGWPQILPGQLVDAMAKARAHALPGKLVEAARVLGTKAQKDPEGDRLLRKFSVPRNPTKGDPRLRVTPQDDWIDANRLYAYCIGDVAAESEIASLTPEMTEQEIRYWRNDQTINQRGVQIDLLMVEACIAVIEQATRKYEAELEALAGCKPTEVEQLKGWLHAQGVHLDSLDEDAVEFALTKMQLPPQARRALEIRAIVGSASVKKVFAMRNRVSGGRLHDLYTWHGARTGRPTGEGPQPTNLPKAGPDVHRCGWLKGRLVDPTGCGRHFGGHTFTCPWCAKTRGPDKPGEWSPAAADDALIVIASRSLELVQWYFGDAMHAIAGVLRALFIAKSGHRLVSSDFSAIEGVVIAALAGEEWRLEVFRTHGKIYEMSAAKILGIPFDDFAKHRAETGQHHPARQSPGKIAELGLGFGGWINAWKQFDGPGTDDEIKANIIAWREASPAIVNFWGGQRVKNPDGWGWIDRMFGLEGAAVSAVLEPGKAFRARGIKYVMHGDVLYCRLLSGRLLTYHRPRLVEGDAAWRGLSLSYEGWNTNPKTGPVGWVRMNTYAGKLAENVVQATARDIQMHAIEQLELAGYAIVLHTYDEVVAEVPEDWGSVEELERIMATLPDWAADWPIKATGGWQGSRYRKG